MVRKQGIDTEFPFDEAGSTMAEVTKEDTDVSETERKAGRTEKTGEGRR